MSAASLVPRQVDEGDDGWSAVVVVRLWREGRGTPVLGRVLLSTCADGPDDEPRDLAVASGVEDICAVVRAAVTRLTGDV